MQIHHYHNYHLHHHFIIITSSSSSSCHHHNHHHHHYYHHHYNCHHHHQPCLVNIAESPGLTLSPMDIFGKIPQKTSSAIFLKRSQWNILILSNLLVGSAKEFAALVSPMMYFFQPGLCSTTLCMLWIELGYNSRWVLIVTSAQQCQVGLYLKRVGL